MVPVQEFPDVFVVFAGDQGQLAPVHGNAFSRWLQLQKDAGVKHITLLQHEFARSTDPTLLDFLKTVRCHRPSRASLDEFFGGRLWECSPEAAIAKSMELERTTGKSFVFLTVTNGAAARWNQLRRQGMHHSV